MKADKKSYIAFLFPIFFFLEPRDPFDPIAETTATAVAVQFEPIQDKIVDYYR